MHGAWAWLIALMVYLLFLAWYTNWRGKLRPEEIRAFLDSPRASEVDPELREAVRSFLEADDGREFFMVNLVRLRDEPVERREGGSEAPARTLRRYTRYFMPRLLLRAGHPVFYAPAAGRYLERWGVEPDPGWSFVGIVRYRSRRDMLELAADPRFASAHEYKRLAMACTLAFPTAPAWIVFGPRIGVALALALVAALAS